MKPDIIRTSAFESFSHLAKQEKGQAVRELQIGVTTVYAQPIAGEVLSKLEELGFTPICAHKIMGGVAGLIKTEGITLPTGRKYKFERAAIVTRLMEKIHFNTEGRISVDHQDGILPINQFLEETQIRDEDITQLSSDSMVYGKILEVVREQLQKKTGHVVETDSPSQFPIKGPRITITHGNNEGKVETLRKNSDAIVNHVDLATTEFRILKEGIQFAANETHRKRLHEAISEHEVPTVPKFRLSDWPKDAMMTSLRSQVGKLVADYESKNEYLGDPKDLKYQTLFRLTTFPVTEIFQKGDQLEDYLRKSGAYKNWRNILRLDQEFVGTFNVSPELVKAVAEEQAMIINDRVKQSDLPLQEILNPTGIFAQNGWVIQKRNGSVYAVQEEGATSNACAVDLRFEEIDPELANKYHRDLHYIHTPRTDIAFGLFVNGDSTPFSVVALEKIDRAYKANALLYQGYDPRKCYDLTRLYSKPGTPGNTSSSMFTLAFNYLKTYYPDTQAILSSFMPSYATGVSMTSGGFDDPILAKPLQHTFVSREIDGKKVFEHVTNRRMEEYKGDHIYSRIPLLPTIELMTDLQSPRYTPMAGADRLMIVLI